MASLHSAALNFGIGLLSHLCGHKHLDQQVDKPRHRHVPATIQKRIFESLVLGLNPIVRVIVQLPPHTVRLDPHLQINSKKNVPPPNQETYISIMSTRSLCLPSFLEPTGYCNNS